MIYEIYYTETYGSTYYVEADNEDDAKELLVEAFGMYLDGPEECCDSETTVTGKFNKVPDGARWSHCVTKEEED